MESCRMWYGYPSPVGWICSIWCTSMMIDRAFKRKEPLPQKSKILIDDLDAFVSDARAFQRGDAQAERDVAIRMAELTKPEGSLGRLEDAVGWLARWQGSSRPRLDNVDILVFAGNHGVVNQGVSPYPAEVTEQMVANFANGGAAINQLARSGQAGLRVIALDIHRPTADITQAPAMDESALLNAMRVGAQAVKACDLLCLGEMGIGNTTIAATLSAGLFGGDGTDWAGRGTGLDDEGLSVKRRVIDRALSLHRDASTPLAVMAALGGRELAAILGAVWQARRLGIPVLLDGFVCTSAAAPLAVLAEGGLDHTLVGHLSAEPGHRRILERLGKEPLLDLGMRLGEASGAAIALPVLRAALACYNGMATFAEASVARASAAIR
ncbi:nicotinate-nucleotide--dimethylbenzimidazole phosphoribosyltransferase [Granulibacter bethesdensis]|uniref:nicotinate-nucleotide--dimethylbenzimidazole phosphoribosyltransferase n=1 Tax=Granulibacter bethesdensis TaxID=364410 RepID=UPI00090B7BE0|nr:nicotinate-nucleotide--dimethylbenzimidazole phosphoribosyltransferase [Granulibacter bethesdensis]APH58989.1 Nicotinate-nucleotide--dimethylbenzimidazole phosphoribosyltransferase [Granulibacter bethesdensis]